jgi:DNA-directed RNA polymerase specialized sigma24 family protein
MSTNSADQPGWSPLIAELVRLIGELIRIRFVTELVRLRQDPEIFRLARRWAGSRELAEDGLQETFFLLATIRDAGQILNLRAYFCMTLYHAINSQRSKLVLVVDLDALVGQIDLRRVPVQQPRDVAELADWHVRCERRLARFRRTRGALLARVPASSPDPARYRGAILAVAENLLTEAFYGCLSRAELNADLCTAYPDWFDAAGIADNVRHKRRSRARHDLTAVLRTIDPAWEVSL